MTGEREEALRLARVVLDMKYDDVLYAGEGAGRLARALLAEAARADALTPSGTRSCADGVSERKPHSTLAEAKAELERWADLGVVEQMREDAGGWVALVAELVEQLEAAQQIERVVRDDYYAMARHYGDAPEEWWPQLWTVLNDSNPATRPDGPEYDERVSELDIPGAEAGWTGAPDPACSHPDASFDRSLCGMCGSMHYFCTECGAQTDECSPALSPEHRPDCGRRDDHEAPRECAVD